MAKETKLMRSNKQVFGANIDSILEFSKALDKDGVTGLKRFKIDKLLDKHQRIYEELFRDRTDLLRELKLSYVLEEDNKLC